MVKKNDFLGKNFFWILAIIILLAIFLFGYIQYSNSKNNSNYQSIIEEEALEMENIIAQFSEQNLEFSPKWSSNTYAWADCSDQERKFGGIEVDRELKEIKFFDYVCSYYIDGIISEAVSGSASIQGEFDNLPIGTYGMDNDMSIFKEHKVKWCCYLGEYSGKKDSQGKDMFNSLTDEVCIEKILSPICD